MPALLTGAVDQGDVRFGSVPLASTELHCLSVRFTFCWCGLSTGDQLCMLRFAGRASQDERCRTQDHAATISEVIVAGVRQFLHLACKAHGLGCCTLP